MSAPLKEILVNNAVTTLNGAIDDNDTAVVVSAGSVFPSTGNFRVKVEDEIMLCTARSGNTLTVVRGQESTVAASHADSTAIIAPATAGGLLQWGRDNHQIWSDDSSPPLGRIVGTNGTTILTVSDFTWVNQGTSVATDQNGTIHLRIPAVSGENVRALVRSAPSTPWSVIAAFQYGIRSQGIPNGGICTRESSTGELCLFAYNADSSGCFRPGAYNMNSPTAFSGNIQGRNGAVLTGKELWMKLQDTGTNIVWSLGFDGIEWVQIVSVSRTAHMAGGPDQVGFYLNHFNGNGGGESMMRLLHWSYGT